jgi:YbbR domain-containing protein
MAYHPFRNLGLKVLSLVLALVLWLTVTRDQVVERSLRVPLEYQSIPAGLVIAGDPPGAVDVRVRGASSTLGRLEPGAVVAVLDLQGARPGQRLFHLLVDEVRAPYGVQVSQVSPPTVSLEFERSGRKVVPVVPFVEGEPAEGFVVSKVTVDPTHVDVVGPESRLVRLTEATTEPVSVHRARGTVRDVVTIGVVDAALRLRETRTASVVVEVVAAPVERTITGVPVALRHVPGSTARLSPPAVDVVVRGSRAVVDALTADTVKVFVDVAVLKPGQYVLPVKGEPGGDYGIVRTEPATVRARIR